MSECDENPSSLAFTAAAFSAIALLRIAQAKRTNQGSLFGRRKLRQSDSGGTAPGQDLISARGTALLTPSLPYINDYFKCLEDQYDPYSNPRGHIPLCISENKLAIDTLASRLMQVNPFSDSIVYSYNNFLGLPSPREALAYFLTKHFLFPEEKDMSYREALKWISPDCVAFGSGAGSLLNHLAMSLAEKGEAVLIPAPYYAGFDSDMKLLAGCVTVPVHSADPSAGPTAEELEEAALAAESRGLRIKILLITNPHNPLGTIYTPESMKSMIDWARSRNLHTIVDEIYALSTHYDFGHGFESVLRTLKNDLGNDIHHIWALSKDFGSSGFRVGTLYTQNMRLLASVANLNIFSCVAHPMQMMLAEIFFDDNFIYPYLHEARTKIRCSYELCTKKLDDMVIPYVPAKAGIFVYADFSSLLPEQTPEGEARFAKLVLDSGRLIMTPGQAQHDRKPGMFRICYCFVTPDVLQIAMERLDKIVGKIRRWHWDNLNSESLNGIIT